MLGMLAGGKTAAGVRVSSIEVQKPFSVNFLCFYLLYTKKRLSVSFLKSIYCQVTDNSKRLAGDF